MREGALNKLVWSWWRLASAQVLNSAIVPPDPVAELPSLVQGSECGNVLCSETRIDQCTVYRPEIG